jgi:hypothetical protein
MPTHVTRKHEATGTGPEAIDATRIGSGSNLERALPPSPEAGEAIPDQVKKAWWWKGLLLFWFLWNLFVTGAAVIAAVNGEWSEFAGFCISAVGLWVGFLIALGGVVPPDFGS